MSGIPATPPLALRHSGKSGETHVAMPPCRHAALPPFRHAAMPLCRSAAVWCLAMLAPRLHAQAPVIDTVIVITHDVFDAEEASRNTAFAIANALRFKTRPQVVRRELLFRPGQPYDSARVAESERNLRRLGLFRQVTIDTTRLNGKLAAVVETRDGWTTELQFNARSTGGEFTWSAGLEERDFLGVAAAVGATEANRRMRATPDGQG